MLAADVVARCGRWLSIGAMCGLGAALAAKAIHIPLAWPWLIGTPLLIAAAGAIIASLARSRSLLSAASVVEEQLGLKSRLSTGLALGSVGPSDDPFQTLAAEDAELASMQAGTLNAVPIRFGRGWLIWPGIAALAVGTALWVPHVDLFGTRSRVTEDARRAEQRTLLAQEIAEAMSTAQSPEAHDAAAARPEQIKVLEQIEKELAAGVIDPRSAAQRASEAMTTLADAKDAAAEQADREQQAMRQTMGALPEQQSGSTLSRAMREGDLAGAAQAAESLAENARTDAEQRAAAAAELEQLASDLRRLSEREDRDAQRSDPNDAQQPTNDHPQNNVQQDRSDRLPKDIQEQLRQQGVDDKTRDALAQSQDLSEIDKRLKEAGVEPEAAERLAREITRENQDRETNERVREQTRELADAAQKAARELREPPKPADARKSSESAAETTPSQSQKQSDTQNRESAKREPDASIARPQSETSSQKQSGADKQKSSDPASSGERQQNSQKSAPEGQRSEQSSKTANQQQSPQKGMEQSADKGSREQVDKGSPERSDSGTQTKDKKSSTESGAKPDPSSSQSSERQAERQSTQSGGQSDGVQAGDRTPEDSAQTPQKSGEQPSTEAKPSDKAASDPAQGNAPAGKPSPSSKSDRPQDSGRPEQAKQQAEGGEPPRPGDRAPQPSTPAQDNAAPKRGGSQPQTTSTDPENQGQQQNPQHTQEQSPDPDALPSKDEMKQFADRLREQAEKGQNAPRDQQQARDLRKRAEDMLERMSPEQREQMRQWARDMPRDGHDRPQGSQGSGNSPAPVGNGAGDQPPSLATASESRSDAPHTELIDGRTRTPSDRTNSAQDQTIAQWLGSGDARGESGGEEGPSGNDGAVREAMRSAERAIDERAVPKRFDNLLQRYFRRLPQNLEGNGGSPTTLPASQPAKDAP